MSSFTYDLYNGEYVIKTVTDGESNVTTYNYGLDDANGNYTEVVRANGETTRFYFNSDNQLTRVQSPAVNGQPLITTYGYRNDGELDWVEDPSGNRTVFEYDAKGNQIYSRDSLGNVIERIYSNHDLILNETIYLTPDPDGSGSDLPSEPVTNRFIYDLEGHLRFTVNAEGEVKEFRYNASGEIEHSIGYASNRYGAVLSLNESETISLSSMETWVNNITDKSNTQITYFEYDFRKQLSAQTTWYEVGANGVGLGAGSKTSYVYDQQGQLLKSITQEGVANATSGYQETSYTYDGLGRLLTTTDAKGQVVTSTYDDANSTISIDNGVGLTTSSVFDKNGQLLSVTQTGNSSGLLGQMTYTYDNNNRLVAITDAHGYRSYTFYDSIGRVKYNVDAYGAVSEKHL